MFRTLNLKQQQLDPDLGYIFLSNFYFHSLAILNFEVLGAICLVILLLVCSALISGSEVAFFSLSPNDIDDLNQENDTASNRILALKEQPRRLLATILISNNFINIGIVILSDFIIKKILPKGDLLNWVEGNSSWLSSQYLSSGQIATGINFFFTIIVVTFLLVLFGEVAPKVYANLNNIKLARFMSGTLSFLNKMFTPISSILVSWTNMIEKRLATRAQQASMTSKEDIDEAIKLTVLKNADSKEEGDILKSLVKFGDVTAKQVMRSRVDVKAVDFRVTFKELTKMVIRTGYSRFPVYDDDLDNITGILYAKDLIGHLDEDENFEWQALIQTDVLYVPEAKKINELLKQFQKERLHMAIVVDEYGGCSGIVTLEDILEEVIGEIKDEFDDDIEIEFKKLDDHNYIFEGKTLLNDVCRVLGIETDTFDEVKEDADSIAGLMLELAGYIPKINSEISFEQYQFKVVSVNRRRIKQVQITIP